MKNRRLFVFVLALTILTTFTISNISAQDDGGFGMGLGLNLGVQTFDDGSGNSISYQKIGFVPDLAFGNFGLSLDLSFHVAPSTDPSVPIQFRTADWVPSDANMTFLELYLPKFNYVRYGLKGDPLYVKFGSISDGTLGNGFIMGNYNNTLFQPDEKLFGMSFDLDGALFNFPYVGFELFAGNMTHFDVVGTRLFGRPLTWSDFPIVKDLEIGFTYATDLDPDYRRSYFDEYTTAFPAEMAASAVSSVAVMGLDFVQPILSNPIVSLAGFGDIVFQPNGTGGMLGVGGRLISFIPYAVQLRIMGDNFIPVYFDGTYDLYRAEKYMVSQGILNIPGYVGWMASTGFSLLDDKIILNIAMDGPFKAPPTGAITSHSASEYPHLKGTFILAEGLLPGFSVDAYYDKKYITSLSDLIDQEGALIGANINYKTGPAIITLAYEVRYNPTSPTGYDVAAKLITSLGLF